MGCNGGEPSGRQAAPRVEQGKCGDGTIPQMGDASFMNSADTENQIRAALIDMPNLEVNNGYIYVIANQDLTKIGITTDLKRRMKELSPDKIYVADTI